MKKLILSLVLMAIVLGAGCVQSKEVAVEKVQPLEAQEEVEAEEMVPVPEAPIEEPIETLIEEPEILVEESVEQVEEPPADPNLIAHWKFDDNADDSAGDYNGIVKGGAAFVAGKTGKALSFDGVDDYVDLPQSAVSAIGSLGQGTIAFWFKFNSLLDKQTVMPIFYIGMDDEGDKDNIFIIEIGHFDERTPGALAPNNKKLYVTWIRNNNDPFLCYDSNVNLEEDKWHHFAVVVSPDGNTGYLNGVEMTNRHYNFGRSSDSYFLDDIPNLEKVMLGYGRSSYMVGPDFVYYKGALDDFRIYDKALNSGEVNELLK